MGCCSSRKETDLKLEETLILPFERSLSIQNYSFSQINAHISKCNQSSYLTFIELSRIFEALHLTFQEIFEFYDQFDRNRSRIVTEKKFSLLQLQTLFLLLCKGETKEKLQLWFKLYDDGKKSVVKTKVEEMLENLFKVLIDYILGYVLKKNSNNLELENYSKMLENGKNEYMEVMSDSIRSGRNLVTENEFIGNCLKSFGKNALSTIYLRDQVYKLVQLGKSKLDLAKGFVEVKKKPPLLSFDDLSDISMTFDNKGKINHKKTSSAVSIFSNDSTTNKKQSLRYDETGIRRFSILEPLKNQLTGDGENSSEESEKEQKSLKKMKTSKVDKRPFLLPVTPHGKLNKDLRRGSFNGMSPSAQNNLNLQNPNLAKRFSIIVTSNDL